MTGGVGPCAMTRFDPIIWRQILAYLRQRHAPICRQWFDQLKPVNLNHGLLEIRTPNRVQQNYLQRKCLSQFTEAAQGVTGALVAVRFVAPIDPDHTDHPDTRVVYSHESNQSFEPSPTPAKIPLPRSGTDHNTLLDQAVISPDHTFDCFIRGPGNELAFAAAMAVADQPGTAYNPLFIHGGVGLGKTHLLQAICQAVLDRQPRTRLCYLSCETFINQFVESVQNGQMNQFRDLYRHVDILVIDDIQFLANRERTQEEFFHTFNSLYLCNRQIVLSCDTPPIEIPKLEERLVSRFQWGLVVQVSRPSYETRVAIVQSKARQRGLELPREVVEFIASRIQSNVRELEGAINTVQASAILQNKLIDLNLAKHVLGDTQPNRDATLVPLQDIIDAVTSFYNVKLSDLQSKRRHKSISLPRQVCMWLARKRTRYSLEEIGGYFGGRDHTTVMHSIKTVEIRLASDSRFVRETEQIMSLMNRQTN